ncbi:hypothetical protein MMC12_004875 [Toensbergia leucococca]|nr:hypothetical protein [Toensbergia leucococca]
MVYHWEDKETVCYRMYIDEKKSLEDIMEYWKAEGFAPSKRAFQTQFKRWEFPSKQNPAHRNAPLVEKVKELWERNTSQKDMLRILNEDLGFDIKERELMRVRAKNRWLLRVPNGMKTENNFLSKRVLNDEEAALRELAQAMYPDMPEEGLEEPEATPKVTIAGKRASPELAPEVIAKRKERLEKLQAESAERWASRKRRRRTRGWAGLPADPPGPPRFPSETTIDESKQSLSLDADMYRDMRDHFQRICEQAGVIKKTIAGPERWQAVKDQLIQESLHLQTVFWGNNIQIDAKGLALDVVCTDVTKRMRTLERRMTIAEAKNSLGINPEESRQVRTAFYQTLKADHFTSKLEAGDEHWKELKAQWIQGSDLLQQILAPGDADPDHATKVKAMEVLCRDVMKRLRDDQTKRDPSRKKVSTNTTTTHSKNNTNANINSPNNYLTNGISNLASRALASAPSAPPQIPLNTYSDLQIDPSLLLAANDPSLSIPHPHPHHPTPVYFRLSPLSPLQPPPNLWLGTLPSPPSVLALRSLALSKHAQLPVQIAKIEGVVRDAGGQGEEAAFAIDEDDELRAYLSHVRGGKATFVVRLIGVA